MTTFRGTLLWAFARLAVLLVVCVAARATVISDVHKDGHGNGWNGSVTVRCGSDSQTVAVTNGAVSVTVAGTKEGLVCSATFVPKSRNESTWVESWTAYDAATMTLDEVRSPVRFLAKRGLRYDAAGNVAIGTTVLSPNVGVIAPNVGAIVTTGLLAEYRFMDGSGAQLTDYSGNGNHGTVHSGVTWASGSGLQFNGSAYVDLPISGAQTVTVQVWADGPVYGSTTGTANAQIIGTSDNSFRCFVSADSTAVRPTIYWASTMSTRLWDQPYPAANLYTFVLDASDAIYINDAEGVYVSKDLAGARGKTGTLRIGGANFTGKVYWAAVYSSALTTQQVKQNFQVVSGVLARRGVALSGGLSTASDQLIFYGDSHTTGMTIASVPTAATYDRYAIAEGGSRTDQWIYRVPTTSGSIYRPKAARNVAVVWLGTNDMGTGSPISPSATYANLVYICRYLRGVGYKVVVTTAISRIGNGYQGTSNDSLKNQYNALIRGNWYYFADSLSDLAADANLGCDGCHANATYFSDGIHLTAAGYSIAYAILGTGIDSASPTLVVRPPTACTGMPAGAIWNDSGTLKVCP